MQNNFSELGISIEILKAIEEMGFVEPTQVQSEAIPSILNHQDVIVMSKTGSGKTAVFGIPMLQMTNPNEPGPQGLILTPTRELAVQVDEDLKLMSKYLEHKTAVVYGQHSMNTEVLALKRNPAIVTGTPGRVFDHLQQRNFNTKNIKFLVLDEADRMLDMGFLNQVVRIIKTLPKNRVTLLFSATIPFEIQRISRDFMNNPLLIEIESPTMTVDTIQQIYYRLNRNEKQTQLNRILLAELPENCMIFCNTRMATDHVQRFLTRQGYMAQALHGDIAQSRRMKTIEQFKKGDFHILVATDVAARGIHVDDLSLVINYDVPFDLDGYVHRIGRTGRAGNKGLAITLVSSEDIMGLYAIEEHIGTMIAEEELPSDEYINENGEAVDRWIAENSIRNFKMKHPGSDLSEKPISAEGFSKSSSPKSGRGKGNSTRPAAKRPQTRSNDRTPNRVENNPPGKNISNSYSAPHQMEKSDITPALNAIPLTSAEQKVRDQLRPPVAQGRAVHKRSFGGDSAGNANQSGATTRSSTQSLSAKGTPVKNVTPKSAINNPVKDETKLPTDKKKPVIKSLLSKFFDKK